MFSITRTDLFLLVNLVDLYWDEIKVHNMILTVVSINEPGIPAKPRSPGRPGEPFEPGKPSRPLAPGIPGRPGAPGRPVIKS